MPEIRYYGSSPANFTYGRSGRAVEYIAIHYTGGSQTAEGAAWANCNYFANGSRQASAHYFVDDGPVIWQSVAEGDTAWAVGNWDMNCRSISIEVCTAWAFTDKEVANANWLVRQLMARYGVPASRVIRHYDVSGKPCPEAYVAQAAWDAMRQRLTAAPSAEQPWWDVWQYAPNQTDAQRWRVIRHDDGTVSLQPLCRKEMRLDLSGNSGEARTKIQVYLDNGTNAQRWRLVPVEGTSLHKIEHATHKGMNLDVVGASRSSQAQVWLYPDNGSGAQRFALVQVPDAEPDVVYIVNANSLLPLDVVGGGR